jgi:hypothetical protein
MLQGVPVALGRACQAAVMTADPLTLHRGVAALAERAP